MVGHSHARELASALGSPRHLLTKLANVATVVRNTLDRPQRVERMEVLREAGRIDEIPTEWQIAQAAVAMQVEFILPSNDEFFVHYERNPWWLIFLRFLDEPSTLLDPSGLAISRDVLIEHLLHAVHCSAGYDIGLLEMLPDGLGELERQLQALIAGTHPRQDALTALMERPDYPERLLAALHRYRADPEGEWAVLTYDAPEDCQALFEEGIERFGTVGRFLTFAASLPRTPLHNLGLAA